MIKNILAIFALVIVAVGGALIIQKGGQNFSQIPSSSQLAQVPTTGLVGYYSFDEGSGSTASGATISGATWTTGKVGGALSFNGSGNNVNVGSDVVGTGDDSVCAWVYPRSLGGSGYSPTIFSNGRFGLFMLKEYPSYKFSFTNGTNFPSVGLTDLNKWTHICVSRASSGSATVYVNGSVAGTVDGGAPAAGYNALFIGNRSQGDQGFDGIIDEVRIYNKTLSSSEVTAIYNYSGTTPPPPTTDTISPVISSVNASPVSDTRSSNATITWTTNESSDSYVEYGLTTAYGSNTALDANLVTAHSQVLLSLSPSTTYHFIVKSKDAAGNLATSPDQTFVTPVIQSTGDLTPPSTPAKLVASVVSTTQINLTWGASTDSVGVTGYRVYRNGVQVGTTATASYSDTGLTAGTAYSYIVAAYDAAGNISNQSTAVSATTQTASTVTGKFKIGDRVQVTNTIAVRSSPTAEITTNKLGTQPVNTTGTVSTGTTYANPTKSADGLIWSYIDYDNSTLDGWSTESYLSAYTTTFTVTKVISTLGTGSGTISCNPTTCSNTIGSSVTLIATPTTGSSFAGWSGICTGSATTCTVTTAGTATATFNTINTTDGVAPTTPQNLAATVMSSSQINLTWTASTDNVGVKGYYVYRDGLNIANITPAQIAFSNTTLSPNTTYTYTVSAYDAAGNISAQSTGVTKTTTANPTPTITASSGTNGTVTPAGVSTVTSGTSKTYTITPNTGYQIASLTVDGSTVAVASSYTFSNVTANHTISATFSAVVSNTPTATLSASPSSVTSGSASTITWSSTNVTSCSGTGTGFSTVTTAAPSGATSGSDSTGALTTSTTYGLTCNGTNGSVTATPVTVGVTVPGSAYQLPAERSINWIGSAGIPGGIPNRTSISTTVAAGGNIQNALNSAAAGTVVQLSAGTYSISGLVIPSNVTLRGAGPGVTILNTTGGGSSGAAVRFGSSVQGEYVATAHDINSGYTKGSASIVLNNTSGISVGTLLIIDQLNDSSLVTNQGTYGTINWNSRNSGARVQGQTVEVKSISGNQVTFDPPLYMTYKSNLAPQAMSFNAGATMAGLENLTIKANNNGYTTMIGMDGVKYSWVKGVETDFADGDHMHISYGSFRNEVRNSYFHDGFKHAAGSTDTDLMIDSKSSANLIENNIFFRMHVSIMLNWGTSGNVLGYNYSSGNYHDPAPDFMIQDMSGNHGAHPMFNLWEGNIATLFHEDSYWGSSSHNTYFRNFGTGDTMICTPFNARYSSLSGCHHTLQALRAFDTDYQQQYTSWIANVSGSDYTKGKTQSGVNGSATVVSPQSRPYSGAVTLFSVGYGDSSDSGSGGSPNLSSKVYSTLLSHANYDSKSGSVVNKAGELTAMPSSMYLTSKPTWFGNTQWPSIGPDISGGVEGGGHVVLNPAGKCFTTYLSTGTGRFDPTTCYGQ